MTVPLQEIRKALEPFARQDQIFDGAGGVEFDDRFEPFDLTTNGHRIIGLTVGDLRRARRALALLDGLGEVDERLLSRALDAGDEAIVRALNIQLKDYDEAAKIGMRAAIAAYIKALTEGKS